MNLIKKLLRGLFYMGVRMKKSYRAYIRNENVPKIFRNGLVLVLLCVAVIGGSWALVNAMIKGAGERTVPVQTNSQNNSSSSKDEMPPSSAESAQSEPAESEPEVDVMASATRHVPISAEQLSKVIDERALDYFDNPVFIPPAAGDIAGWQKINSDVFGWLTISNTNISYPVVKGPYTDYYTSRGYYKEYSTNGVIWADSDTKISADGKISSMNTVLYGHNWTNIYRPTRIGAGGDVMFAQLAAYDHEDFAKANPYIRLTTLAGDNLYQVFAVFYTTLDFSYNYADLSVSSMQSIYNTAKSKSIHDLGVSVNAATDQVITLSTCTRVLGPGSNQRFVVMAKKIQ